MNAEDIVKENKIYECLCGSHAYGLNTPASDKDIRGVFIAPPTCDLGLRKLEQYRPKNDATDEHYFSLREIANLMASGAPNLVEMLFVSQDAVILKNSWWTKFAEYRHLFLTRQVAVRANSFIHNMRSRSIGNKQKIDISVVVELTQSGVWKEIYDLLEAESVPEPVIKQGLESIKVTYQQHIKRAAERKVTAEQEAAVMATARKQAMHGVRIGRMALTLVQTGEMIVDRSFEREDLLAIRRGETPLEAAIEETERLSEQIKEALPKSSLPENIDRQSISDLVMDITVRSWKQKRWI